MKRVYIAGPYCADTEEQLDLNIIKAGLEAEDWWELGFFVLCPHKNSAYFEEDRADYYKGYLSIIKDMDIAVLLDEWETSKGTKAEIDLFILQGKPVVYPPDESHTKWLIRCQGKEAQFDTREEAAKCLLSERWDA